MFRSARRELVFPQAEHARLAATIADAWGNDVVAPPPLPRDRFVRAVALHDRGYAPFDTDGIGEVAPARWLEIQRESFRPRGEDAIVDLVVAMHVQRLIRWSRDATVADELTGAVEALREQAGVSPEDAAAADLITNMCDRIAFDFCFEEPTDGELDLPAAAGEERLRVRYELTGEGKVELDPWPLSVSQLAGLLFGFAAGSYPEVLAPTVVPFELVPGGG
jgi:Protein of unknown function (DUF3891)